MFKRLRMTFDFYSKRTSNLLFAVPISGVIGVTSIWQNIGELTNTGFETTLSADIIKSKDLTWTVDANLSTNSNKIRSCIVVETRLSKVMVLLVQPTRCYVRV